MAVFVISGSMMKDKAIDDRNIMSGRGNRTQKSRRGRIQELSTFNWFWVDDNFVVDWRKNS
jgi:hypothetical protein